jgi:hypothetical protein
MKKRRLKLLLVAAGAVVLGPPWRLTARKAVTWDYYSFPGDYTAVYAAAAAELTAAGFHRTSFLPGQIRGGEFPWGPSCHFRRRGLAHEVKVAIDAGDAFVRVRVQVLTLDISLRDRLRYFFGRSTASGQKTPTATAPQGVQ